MTTGDDPGRDGLAERDALLAALPEAACLVDPGGACTEVNDAAVRLAGARDRAELLRPVDVLVRRLRLEHPDGRPVAPDAVTRVLRGARFTDAPLRLRERRHGEVREVLASGAPVIRAGQVAGAVFVVRDVTALRAAEAAREALVAALEEKRQLLEIVLENAPVFVALVRGPDFVVEFANPRFRSLLPGRPLEGRRLLEDVAPELAEQLLPELRHDVRAGTPRHFEDRPLPLPRAPGGAPEEAWFTYSRVPVHLPDGEEGLLLVGSETTEQVRTRARLVEALHARDDFLALLAHELRTPLTALTLQLRAIEGLATGADAPRDRRDLRSFAQGALQSVRRLVRLSEDLAEATREGPVLALEREDVDLREVVREAVDELVPDARGLGCVVELDAPEPVHGRWDRRRLHQLVRTVLSNALKFGRGGDVQIAVARDGEVARLVVTDHGIGVPPGEEERVFDRFERAVSPLHFGGLGLGLFVARRIAAAHGGTITLDSGPEPGTRVTVTLPRRGRPEPTPPPGGPHTP